MAMQCPKCGKESNNLRVCPFCQTPYPIDGSARTATPRITRAGASPRTSTATSSSGLAAASRIAMARQSRAKRWGVIGLLAAFTAGDYFMTPDPGISIGVAIPNLIAGPMTPRAATGILQRVNDAAPVELRDGELTVRVAAATFPERRDG